MRLVSIAALTLAVWFGCGAALASESAVRETLERIIDAMNREKVGVLESYFDSGYTVFPEGSDRGREKINFEALQTYFDSTKTNLLIDKLKIQIYGNVAVATYLEQGTITDAKNRNFRVSRRATDVLRRTGGRWKLVHSHRSKYGMAKQQPEWAE